MNNQETNHSKFGGISRTIIITITLLVVLVSIGVLAYKFYKSSKHKAKPIDDTVELVQKKAVKIDSVNKQSKDSLLTVKLNQLYNQYCIKDTVPKQIPPFLEEAFMGYTFNDYIYFKQLDLAAVPEKEKADSVKYANTMLLGNYYKGVSLLMLNDAANAIRYFDWVINNTASAEYISKAQWYLAMADIKMNQLKEAVILLQRLTKTKSHKTNAEKFLNQLAPLI